MKFAASNDNIDIIIYVIIMVVGLIANAYRNYTKRKEVENRQPGEVIPEFPEVEFDPIFGAGKSERREPVFEEIVVPEFEAVPEPVTEISSTIDSQPELEEIISINDTNLIDLPIKEGQAAFESTARLMFSDNISDLGVSLTELQPDNNDILKDEISDFQETTAEEGIDLEGAVIYSEILRQKYFSNSY